MPVEELVTWINKLIKENKLYKFYKHKVFTTLREEVIEENHYECQECLKKKPKVITKATIVHHVQFVRKYPALALSKHYTYKGKTYMQLEPVCSVCHNVLHPEKGKYKCKAQGYTNEERW